MNKFPAVLETISDLNLEQIQGLLKLSQKIKSKDFDSPVFLPKRPIIATSFLEHSTRTKHSFAIAIQRLGAMFLDFDAEQSSLKKGETLRETLLTLNCQGVDLAIIRTSVSGELQQFKGDSPLKIINGGDGINQHPTQALLDLLTFVDADLPLKGKTVSIIGDCRHSRVTHSHLELLPQFGAKIILCGPKNFLPDPSELNGLNESISMTTDLNEAMDKSDYTYLLRVQRERHQESEDQRIGYQYGLSLQTLKDNNWLRPIFHPGPANINVEISDDLIHSPYYFGYEQVRNSIFMRMAIIQAMIQSAELGDQQQHRVQRKKI